MVDGGEITNDWTGGSGSIAGAKRASGRVLTISERSWCGPIHK